MFFHKNFHFRRNLNFRNLLLIGLTSMIAYPLAALKLPTGDSVRAADIKQDRDSIVEVKLGDDKAYTITTPIGAVKAAKGTPIMFYKSGALKSIYPSIESEDLTELETPIGKLILGNSRNTLYEEKDFCCEFYESGSPKRLILNNNTIISVAGREFGVKSGYVGNPTFLSFYDSGSKNILQVKSFFGAKYFKDGKTVESVSYSNKSGKFEICLVDGRNLYDRIDFWQDGSIKAAPLYNSPDEPALVKGNEVYIKGGENIRYNWYYRIHFFPDGSIREFTPDDAFISEQGGVKLFIAAGRRFSLWQNGNIRLCAVSNENSFTVVDKTYILKGKWTYKYRPSEEDYDVYLFNEDGSIKGFAARQDVWSSNFVGERMIATDGFYGNGYMRRTINILEEYTNRRITDGIRLNAYVDSFYNLQGDRFECGDTELFLMKREFPTKSFMLQDGDIGANVANVQFNTDGTPVSYTLFKLDEHGDYILDDYGIPIENFSTRKAFKN